MTTRSKKDIEPKVSKGVIPLEDMDRFFNQMWESGFMRPFEMRWPSFTGFRTLEEELPRVDVIDEETEVRVKAEVPGMSKDNLEVTLADEYITIKGETREEKKEEGEFYRSEIRRESFARTVHLPAKVDGEQAKASFKDGILEVTMPKVEQPEKAKVEIE